jgi:hypothetical protein
MYPVLINSIIQVTAESRALNQQMLSIFHYQFQSGDPITDGGAELDAFWDEFNTTENFPAIYANCMSNEVVDIRWKLQWITTVRYGYKTYFAVDITGGQASPLIAPNAAVALNKRSDFAGPHSHGTVHMPGVPVAFITGGQVNAAGTVAYAALNNAIDDPLATVGARAYKPVIFRKGSPVDSQVITLVTTDFNVRTMHRRTVGLGS